MALPTHRLIIDYDSCLQFRQLSNFLLLFILAISWHSNDDWSRAKWTRKTTSQRANQFGYKSGS